MENMASEFLVRTCRMHKKFNGNAGFLHLIPIYNIRNALSDYRHTVCGSLAEFYIQPIYSCIDDLDVLSANVTLMAFDSSRFELPECAGDLSDVIVGMKLESYEQNKSFVRLGDLIFGAYDWHLEQYYFTVVHKTPLVQPCLSPEHIVGRRQHTTVFYNGRPREANINEKYQVMLTAHGPAVKSIYQVSNKTRDVVWCVRCPVWPLVAEAWPKRERHAGWPNSATIAKVVQKGCDVVPVKHRDMLEELNQWRISFSRAEVTLIQSWTPTQQIVYHLLRFFAKRELIRKNCPKKEEVVCTYHLKTLMLWSCEEESIEWWTSSSVVADCCKMLWKLGECLKHRHC